MIHRLVALSPLAVMACTTVVTVLSGGRGLPRYSILGGISLSLLLILGGGNVRPVITDLVAVDHFFALHASLALLGGLTIMTLRRSPTLGSRDQEVFHLLLPMILTGGVLLCSSEHLGVTLVGVEMLSLSLIGLLGCTSRRSDTVVVVLRYALLSASFALLLSLGVALVYTRTGALSYLHLIPRSMDGRILLPGGGSTYLLGMGMLTAGLSFKLALAPFHSWILVVRRNSVSPVPDLLVTVVKITALAALVRLLLSVPSGGGMRMLLLGIASASTCGGGILSLMQEDVRDLLVCSSTLSLGQLLIGCVLDDRSLVVESVNIFSVNYTLTNLSILTLIDPLCEEERTLTLRGLLRRDPIRSAALMLSFLSAAGLPPTSGFVGTLYAIRNCLENGSAWSCAVMILGKILGFCSYLRFSLNMLSPPEHLHRQGVTGGAVSPSSLLLLLLIVTLGVYPQPLVSLARMSLPASRTEPGNLISPEMSVDLLRFNSGAPSHRWT